MESLISNDKYAVFWIILPFIVMLRFLSFQDFFNFSFQSLTRDLGLDLGGFTLFEIQLNSWIY